MDNLIRECVASTSWHTGDRPTGCRQRNSDIPLGYAQKDETICAPFAIRGGSQDATQNPWGRLNLVLVDPWRCDPVSHIDEGSSSEERLCCTPASWKPMRGDHHLGAHLPFSHGSLLVTRATAGSREGDNRVRSWHDSSSLRAWLL
jgi:hypothetical protein